MSNLAPDEIIKFENISVQYKERLVLEDVNFTIKKGEFAYMIGRTGAGKSSLLKLIYADLLPAKGLVSIDKYKVPGIARQDVPYLRRKIGIVFQDFQLLTDRTVAGNIAFAMKATGWTNSSQIKNRITDVLMMVGLSAKMNNYPHQLSGGEMQRTVIARALVNDPLVLVADEPTGNLDPEVTDNIMEILLKINRGGTAVVMATHEHDLLRRFPARVLECVNGKVQER